MSVKDSNFKDSLNRSQKIKFTKLASSISKILFSDGDLLARTNKVNVSLVKQLMSQNNEIRNKLNEFTIWTKLTERRLNVGELADDLVEDGTLPADEVRDNFNSIFDNIVEALAGDNNAVVNVSVDYKWDDSPDLVFSTHGSRAIKPSEIYSEVIAKTNARWHNLNKDKNERQRKIELYKKLKEELGDIDIDKLAE